MSIEMLFFDYRKSEESYFKKYDCGCFNVHFFDHCLDEKTVQQIPEETLEHITVISVFVDSDVSESVLKRFKNLRMVNTRSTGFDHIDIEYCRLHNIAVVNVENYGSNAVAQYTFALILALVRNVIPAYLCMKNELKKDNCFLGHNLNNLTLGVIGTGAIGGSVCHLAHSFGMKTLAYDVKPKKEMFHKCDVCYVELDEIFEKADIISVHAPYTKDNRDMLAKKQFDKMLRKPYIINTSRGELVNLVDLKTALEEEKIRGAALDVLTCESLTFKCEGLCDIEEFTSFDCAQELKIVRELMLMPNVIITPHIAYETQEAIDYILEVSMNAIREYFKGAVINRVV